jgi:predicted nucleic acid-binding protein
VEYFGEGPKADAFEPFLRRHGDLIVPAIVVYEVYKKLLAFRGETSANRFLSAVSRAEIADFDALLAIGAAQVSLAHKLAMADAIIYATAQNCGAELVTSDRHFEGLAGVTII